MNHNSFRDRLGQFGIESLESRITPSGAMPLYPRSLPIMARLHAQGPGAFPAIEILESRIAPAGGIELPLYDTPEGFASRFDGELGTGAGGSVAIIGDINADGFDDFAITGPNFDFGTGRVYVVFGSAGSAPLTVPLDSLDETQGFIVDAVSRFDGLATVAGVGDMNGDGIDDFAIGATNLFANQPGVAKVYVIFGHSDGFGASFDLAGLDGANGFRIDGATIDNRGHFISGAGDVNGDGLGDVIIGASSHFLSDSNEDAAYVVFGRETGFSAMFDLQTLDGSTGFRILSAASGEYFGRSVSSAGDLNGDGYGDVIVGAPLASPNGLHSGSSYVVFGKPAFAPDVSAGALDGSNGFRINGRSAEARLGGAVSGAGDLNGDGLDDVIVGTDLENAAYVVYGNESGFSAVLESGNLNGTNGFRIAGVSDQSLLGRGVSGAGDVNADGIDDIIVSSPQFSGHYGPSAYVIFGNLSGFGAEFAVESLNGANGFYMTGTVTTEVTDVSGRGDINGDGFSDLLLGFGGATYSPNRGSAFVIYHAPDNAPPEIRKTNSATIPPGGSTDPIDVSIYDPELPANALILSAVSSNPALIPNENLVFGGSGSERTITATALPGATGIAFITLQVSDGELTTEQQFQVNVFGPEAVRHFEDLDGGDGYRINGEYAGDRAGTVSGVGDINGDGFDDFVVGVEHSHPHGEDSGAAFVVFGTPGGNPPARELSRLDGANGFQINGAGAIHRLGFSVSGIGDFNGDGFDDLIVGAPSVDNGDDRQGRAYVVFGRASFPAEIEVSALDGRIGFALAAEQGSRGLGKEVAGAGDVNGDGFDDVLITSKNAGFVLFGRAGSWSPEVALATLDGQKGFRVEATPAIGYTSTFIRITAVGDVNGDGFADFGAETVTSRQIVFGHSGTFPATLVATDVAATDGFKINVLGFPKAAGDINGDGYDDFLMSGGGSTFTDQKVSLIYGQPTWDAEIDATILDGTRGFLVQSGYSVGFPAPHVEQSETIFAAAAAGDVNRDGFDDLLLTMPSTYAANDISDRVGTVYLVFGSAEGPGATLSLANLDGTSGVRWNGITTIGSSVSAAGDLNADGFDDFVVGAYGLDGHGPYTGGAFVMYGSGDPFYIEPAISASGRKLTFSDIDGDLVTVKTSAGRFDASAIALLHAASSLPNAGIFQRLSLGAGFAGADLTIKATPSEFGGDGMVNLGFLDASGVDLGKVIIAGDLGRIEAGNLSDPAPALHRLKVDSLGAAGLSNQDPGDASLVSTIAGDVGSIHADEVTGTIALKGGIKVVEGIHDSALHIAGALSRIEVGLGMTNSMLTIRGHLQPTDSLDARALGSADFGSSLVLSRILVGYDDAGLPVNADVQTGRAKVRGDWTASDLIVGATAGPDALFGTDDDVLIPGGGSIVARMAKVVIKGRITGTMDSADSFGVVAEEIVAAKLENRTQVLVSGARNDLQGIRFGADLDVLFHEVFG